MDFYYWVIVPALATISAAGFFLQSKDWVLYYWHWSRLNRLSFAHRFLILAALSWTGLEFLHLVTKVNPYAFDAIVPSTLITLGSLYILVLLTAELTFVALVANAHNIFKVYKDLRLLI